MEYGLDKKDLKILYELDTDARQPISQIAKKVGLSKEVVNYRIKNLMKKGVIDGYYTVIDSSKLGYLYCRLFVKYHEASPEIEKSIVEYAKGKPLIGWIALGHGRWDLTLVIWARNVVELENIFDDLTYQVGKNFVDKYLSIAFKIYHFKHNYLFGTEDNKPIVLGGNIGDKKLDEEDIKILSLLAKDARMPIVDIGKKIGLTPNAVKYRLKRLIKDKIILGFRPKLNLKKFGYDHNKVFLNLRNITKQRMNELISYLSNHKNVIYVTKATGISDLEFEIMLKGKNELYEFMKELRFKFKDIIEDFDSILYYSEPMINYLPIKRPSF